MSRKNSLIMCNSKNTPILAIEKVVERLPELYEKTEAFSRNNSQTTLSMITMTMMTGQSPMRQIRQMLAEIERRKVALAEAQVEYEKLKEYKPEAGVSKNIGSSEERLNSFRLAQLENKITGSIKDLATIIYSYDNLVKKHDINNWSEEDFEKSEVLHHVRRGFELLYRNIIEISRPRESTIEYLQQFGIHIQVALQEVNGYIITVENKIKNKEIPSSSHLEDFLDQMANKYSANAKEVAMRMYGTEKITNTDFMTTWSIK